MLHAVQQALIAHTLKKRDVDYVVRAGEDGQQGGGDRRRVHRPADARAALVRRPAPGGRGEGGHQGPQREPDARLDHLPELLPHVREARRHDRHRRHRGAGVREDLRPRRDDDPDQPPDDPQGPRRTWSTRPSSEKFDAVVEEIKRAPRDGPADPRRHDLDRELGDALGASSRSAASATTC